jgi:hypothetical protein
VVKIAGGSIEVMKHIIGRHLFNNHRPRKQLADGVAGVNPV